jgi:hypothetical protein
MKNKKPMKKPHCDRFEFTPNSPYGPVVFQLPDYPWKLSLRIKEVRAMYRFLGKVLDYCKKKRITDPR